MKKQKMTGVLTLRVAAPLERRLRERARKTHRTPSDVIRDALDRELEQPLPTIFERAGDLIGILDSSKVKRAPASTSGRALSRLFRDRRDE